MTDTDLHELWFERDGTRLYAVERGQGPPIVLLHGGLATHLACREFAAPLDARHRLITPDLRGSGRSVHAGALSWDALADDVAALVRALDLGRVVLGGVSFGAGCAVRTALRHPGLVSALIVLAPAFGGADLGLTSAQLRAMRVMNEAGARAPTDGIGVLYPLLETLPAEQRTRARAVFETYDPASVAATTKFLASGDQPFATVAELRAIDAPTLVIPGTDPYHPVEVADRFRAIPHSRVHAVTAEHYAAEIEAFVASVPGVR